MNPLVTDFKVSDDNWKTVGEVPVKPKEEYITSKTGVKVKFSDFVNITNYKFDVVHTVNHIMTKCPILIIDPLWAMIKQTYFTSPELFMINGTLHQNSFTDSPHISVSVKVYNTDVHLHFNGHIVLFNDSINFYLNHVTESSVLYNFGETVKTEGRTIAKTPSRPPQPPSV